MKILLDLDEVSCDFRTPAWELHGYSKKDADLLTLQTGKYKIQEILDIEEWKFWETIDNAGVDFWANLEPFEWTENLIDLAADLVGDKNWYILTSPSRHPNCVAGKVMWIQKHLGISFNRFIFTGHKYLLSDDESILIDDSERHIKNFNKKGHGILFPNIGNKLREHRFNPVDYLKNETELIELTKEKK